MRWLRVTQSHIWCTQNQGEYAAQKKGCIFHHILQTQVARPQLKRNDVNQLPTTGTARLNYPEQPCDSFRLDQNAKSFIACTKLPYVYVAPTIGQIWGSLVPPASGQQRGLKNERVPQNLHCKVPQGVDESLVLIEATHLKGGRSGQSLIEAEEKFNLDTRKLSRVKQSVWSDLDVDQEEKQRLESSLNLRLLCWKFNSI